MNISDWTRRDFIKAAGGALIMAGAATQAAAADASGSSVSGPDASATGTSGPETLGPDISLKGVSDIHVHAAPDTRARSITELSFAREARDAGYRSVMFKSNDWSCHDRAYLIREALPDFACFGSLIMNRAHGDKVNAYAAEMAVKTTGGFCRCIWMPTLAAEYPFALDNRPREGIPVLSPTGAVLPEVVRVMEVCAEADIMFATGHSAPEESIVLARKAKEVGVGKFVVTHANSLIWKMTRDQISRAVDLGAFIEYSYITNLWGHGTGLPDFERLGDEDFAAFAKIAPERSFITTDLGQVGMPHPLEGMRLCIAALLKAGMPQRDVDQMVRLNPAKLVGLNT